MDINRATTSYLFNLGNLQYKCTFYNKPHYIPPNNFLLIQKTNILAIHGFKRGPEQNAWGSRKWCILTVQVNWHIVYLALRFQKLWHIRN